MAETLCACYASQYGVPVMTARLCQSFGSGVEYNDGLVIAYPKAGSAFNFNNYNITADTADAYFLSYKLGIEPEVWDESRFSPDIVVINLGTNDASWVRGQEDRRISFVNLYEQLLEAIHRRSPKAKILGCLGVMGQELCDSEEEAFIRFARTFPNVKTKFVHFPVQDQEHDGVGTDWHPSAKTHKKMAEMLVDEIKNWK